MDRFQPGKVLTDESTIQLLEGKDMRSGHKVILVRIQASDAVSLRRAMLEIDTLRNLRGQSVCEVYGVDLEMQPGRGWVVHCAKEHCRRNLGLEIKMRCEHSESWSDLEVVQIGTKLRDALLAAQRLGVTFTKLTTRNVLVRDRKEVIFGTCEGAVQWDGASMQVALTKLAVLLTQMALLRSQELTQREGEELLAGNLPGYLQTNAFIRSLVCQNEPIDFRFNSPSLPIINHPTKTCKTCNRDFTVANFHISQLRTEYRRYPQHLDSICSIACLDSYIKYCETMEVGEIVCVVCGRKFRAEMGERMCSRRCQAQVREQNE